jgi:hypothetical protein
MTTLLLTAENPEKEHEMEAWVLFSPKLTTAPFRLKLVSDRAETTASRALATATLILAVAIDSNSKKQGRNRKRRRRRNPKSCDRSQE